MKPRFGVGVVLWVAVHCAGAEGAPNDECAPEKLASYLEEPFVNGVMVELEQLLADEQLRVAILSDWRTISQRIDMQLIARAEFLEAKLARAEERGQVSHCNILVLGCFARSHKSHV